jgi:hypothetical protein
MPRHLHTWVQERMIYVLARERENLRAAFSRFANLKLSAFAPIFFTMNLR